MDDDDKRFWRRVVHLRALGLTAEAARRQALDELKG
jgi:hypothetical protein